MSNDPTHNELKQALNAEKTAVTLGPWHPTDRSRSVEVRSALQVGNIVMRGVTLFLRCYEDRPDEMVSIGLTIETSIGPKCFARIDWRGAPHQNTHHLCGDLQFIDAGRTHFHNPDLCPPDDDPMAHIRGNLPIAVATEPAPQNFEALLDRCGKLLKVENLTEVVPPRWQPNALL